jgi:hypothetical protein
MAAAFDLTTLAAVKSWLGITVDTSDATLAQTITAVSRFTYNLLNRPSLFSHAVTERRDGVGNSRILLRQFPVLSVQSLSVDNVAIPASPLPGANQANPNGWLLDPWDGTVPGKLQALDLYGYGFGRGRQNIIASYTAGYAVTDEAQTIAAQSVTVDAPSGPWGADIGVKFADTGTSLVKVAADPATGQYALDAAVPGKYKFSADDNAKAVLVSYSFVPADVAQFCLEMIAERWTYRGHIGMVSKSLGGQETVTFSQKEMPAALALMIQPYVNVVPL